MKPRIKFGNGWHMRTDDWWIEFLEVTYYSDFKERELNITFLNFSIVFVF